MHTKGPWVAKRLIDNSGKPYSTHYVAHIDVGVCMVWAPEGNAEQESNARLISAAPDLLEALEGLMEIESLPIGTERDKARAAIKKARGE